MARKPTKNLNLPSGMRRREQRSGKVYYYFDTGAAPRKEIPLGPDYIVALRKYADLNMAAAPVAGAVFADVIKKYLVEEVPKLAPNTARMFKSDVKHIAAFFGTAPLAEVRPMHIRQFLDKHRDKPTTANRAKRLFSVMWNKARGWGYTDLENPCTGIDGHVIAKRTYYVTDEVYAAVYASACAPLRDAMDLAYLTGQRPADTLRMTEHDILDGHLVITQEKTKQPLRIQITGKLADLLERIQARKDGHSIVTAALLVNEHGRRLTGPALRYQFDRAKAEAAVAAPGLADSLSKFRFYDLRAKAADDTSDDRGEQAASDLLGHDSVKTTQRHYLRRGKIVAPTK
ncbi:MAG TPA: tyrosine-type recombinase/integrase [Telluria sp.]|jgi:integrase